MHRSALLLFSLTAIASAQVSITEYPVAGSLPSAITAGPDGAIWFADWHGNQIGRIALGGPLTEYAVPGYPYPGAYGPSSITAGPDGAVWFGDPAQLKIGRITTSGTITEYSVNGAGSGYVLNLTTGPDGAIWFAVMGTGIGRMTTAGVVTNFYQVTNPYAITSGPDGALWFTEGSNKIGRITTAGAITEYPVPMLNSTTLISSITSGPDGVLWFATGSSNLIGRITTAGAISEFPSAGYPLIITAGPDGALWFIEQYGNKIGRITTAGLVTEYAIPVNFPGSVSITAGPDGALWFTEYYGMKVGRMAISSLFRQIGVYRPLAASPNTSMAFYLDANGDNAWDAGDKVRPFGVTGIPGTTLNDVPVAGDWDGTGVVRFGVFHCPASAAIGPCTWFIDLNNNGQWDGEFGGDRIWANFGLAGDIPVVGDWTGDGKSKIGVMRCTPGSTNPCVWYLDMGNKHTYDPASVGILFLGQTGDMPAVGSWLPPLTPTAVQIGVAHCPTAGASCIWTVDSSGETGNANPTPIDVRLTATTAGTFTGAGGFQTGDVAVMGNWNATGKLRMGMFRSSMGVWYVDTNGNGVYDAGVDQIFSFGLAPSANPGGIADQPLVGFWTMP